MKTEKQKREEEEEAERQRVKSSGEIGQVGVNSEGHVTMGLGGGLTMDLNDSSLGISTGPGFSIDLGG